MVVGCCLESILLVFDPRVSWWWRADVGYHYGCKTLIILYKCTRCVVECMSACYGLAWNLNVNFSQEGAIIYNGNSILAIVKWCYSALPIWAHEYSQRHLTYHSWHCPYHCNTCIMGFPPLNRLQLCGHSYMYAYLRVFRWLLIHSHSYVYHGPHNQTLGALSICITISMIMECTKNIYCAYYCTAYLYPWVLS